MSSMNKRANIFVKALESYVSNEEQFYWTGYLLSSLLDSRQHNRFVLVWKGYQEGREFYGPKESE